MRLSATSASDIVSTPGGEEREVRGLGGLGDERAEAGRDQRPPAVADVLGDDARVPRAAGGGDEAGHQVREDRRQVERAPPAPAAEAVGVGRLAQVLRHRARAREDVEEDVPLRAEQHEQRRSPRRTARRRRGAPSSRAGRSSAPETRRRPGRAAGGGARRRGESPIQMPAGTAHSAPRSERAAVRRKVRPSAPAEREPLARPPARATRSTRCTAPQTARQQRHAIATSQPTTRAIQRRRRAVASAVRRAPAAGATRASAVPPARSSQASSRERRSEVEHDASAAPPPRRLLDLELLRPRERRSPDELVDDDDHDDHRDDGDAIARRSPRSIATAMYEPMPGQAEVAVAERERLGDGQEEPAARHRHHRVPDQPDRRRRQLRAVRKVCPPAEAVDARDVAQVARESPRSEP